MIGKSLVGKSALSYRFINDKFPTEHDTTIEDQYRINTNVNGYDCSMEILDTAGQGDYQTMLDGWITFADGFMLVYSIDDEDSLDTVKERYERIIKMKGKTSKPQILVVGNKCDLEHMRKVSEDKVRKLCSDWKVDYIESSALQKINVKEAFFRLADTMLENLVQKRKDSSVNLKKRCYCF